MSEAEAVIGDQVEKVNKVVQYFRDKTPDLIDFGLKLVFALLIFFIGVKLIKFILKTFRKSFAKAGLESGSINFLNSLAKAILYVILLSSLAVYLGVKEASIAALIGSMGLGIVLALKESLSNLAGGFILLIMKPFISGDYIKEDNNGNEGTVQEIDLFYTTLVTPDNSTVSIPNGILANSSLTNISRQDKRQLRESIGISYSADIKRAKEVLEYILTRDEGIMQDEAIDVFVNNLGDSSIELGWRAWVRPDDYWTTRWRIIEIIKYEFDKAGLEIPYQQMEVSLRSVKEEQKN